MSTQPVKLMLADDHTLVRAGIRALLEKMPGVTVVAEANDGREVFDLVRQHEPQVILMDISMPGLNGLEATARVVKDYPKIRVIILSRHDNEEYFWQAIKSGAAGYLLKKAATAELEAAIHRVIEGDIYLTKEISDRLVRRFPAQKVDNEKHPLEQLTERQREILQLIAEGQTTKAIAYILKVSPKTVEYHRAKLMERLNIHDIPGLVRFALRMGMITQ